MGGLIFIGFASTFAVLTAASTLRLQVHSNNRHTQGVRVFNKVECQFKPGILQPWSSPLTLDVPLEDLKDPSSRTISLPLGARPAQILLCKFYFADRWLLISEITFLSGRWARRSVFLSCLNYVR